MMKKAKTSLKKVNEWCKKTKESLQKTEEIYRILIENINDVIFLLDTQGYVIYISPVVEQIFQYTVDEVVGRKFSSFVLPDDLPGLMDSFRATLAGHIAPYEFRIFDKDNTIVHVRTYSRPLLKAGHVLGLTGVITDITDSKQAEEALQESEERYRRITEAITHYIYTVYVQDVRPTETTHSPTCVAVTGYTAEDFQKNPYLWIEMVYKDDRDSVRKLAANILSDLKPEPLEHRIIRKDGTLRWVRNTPVLHYDDQGRLASYDGLVQDITDRKQMELALEEERTSLAQKVEDHTAELSRTNAELARAARLKDEFLATMSHELRTPLNVVLGMSEALQREIYGPLNAKQCKALRSVEENGRHLLELITDILDLSNINTGELKLDIAPVAVDLVCQASLRAIHHIAYKKRLKALSMCDSMVTTIYADGLRLKQVLVNLLNNAVKFTPDGGAIGLEVEGDAKNHAVHFTVWDTGIGIAKEEIERLFQPFVQLDSTLSRRYEGTGLGLTLVYRIVDMHGGGVSVESEIGRGSRFTVSLPWQGDREIGRWGDGEKGSVGERESKDMAPPHLPTSPSPHLPISPPPQSATILIADDNEMTIRTLSKHLTAAGYRLTIACNGWEAFAYTRENHPDIIVMDIQMPEMDGLEAIHHIRSDKHGKSIPIIALSALTVPGDREKCLAAGADEYLSKPVSLQRLSEIIKNLLARKQQAQE